MPNEHHPIWKTLHLAVVVGALWLNASHFDETELTSIGQIILMSGAIEFGRARLTR